MAGIRILKKNNTWTWWLKCPGPSILLLILTLAFILSFAWALEESKDKHISALCLPYKDRSIQLGCTFKPPHSLLFFIFYSNAHTRKILCQHYQRKKQKAFIAALWYKCPACRCVRETKEQNFMQAMSAEALTLILTVVSEGRKSLWQDVCVKKTSNFNKGKMLNVCYCDYH